MKRQGEYKEERKYKELEKQAKVLGLQNATSTEELAEMEERTKQMMAIEARLTAATAKKQRLSGTTNEDASDEDSDSVDLNLDISSSSEEEEEELETEPAIEASKHIMTSIQYIKYFEHDSDAPNAAKAPRNVYQDIDDVKNVSNDLQQSISSSSSSTALLSSTQMEIFSKLFRTCYGSRCSQVSSAASATISNPCLNKILWFPSIEEINSSLEFFKAIDSAYFTDSDTSTSHMKRKEPDVLHMTQNLKNWLRTLTTLLDRYFAAASLSGESLNMESMDSSIFQQVLYPVVLFNGFDCLTNACDDLPRRCLESLLKVTSRQTSLYIPAQKVFERVIAKEEHTMPMIFSFANTLLSVSTDSRLCSDFYFFALQRLHKYLPTEVRSKLERANDPTVSLFEVLRNSLQIFIEECSNGGFAGEYFEILLYTMKTACMAFLLSSAYSKEEDDDDNDENHDKCKKSNNSERWSPIANKLVPMLSKKMQHKDGGVNYKLIQQVENLEEALKKIFENQHSCYRERDD